MTGTALILGATGRIGRHATDAFAAAGWTARRFQRGTDMAAAAQGADVIVNGLNPPAYHDWDRLIPAITTEVIAAARASGATVIVPGNVYNFGAEPGLWSETTPQRPITRKGRIRVEMEAAYRASGVPTIILRAGSFIDPEAQGDVMAMAHLRDIRRGKVTALGNPDTRQAYAYLPDWARAAVLLAERRKDLAPFEDIPFAGHTFTTRQLRDGLVWIAGRDLGLNTFPWWLMTALSPFWELAREMSEMKGMWSVDHALDGSKLARLCPEFRATPLDEVLDVVAQAAGLRNRVAATPARA
jgi:nucleoside-diphosphate-sugar epimerase